MTTIRTLIYFLLTGLAWGTGFLFIRVSIEGLSPLQFVVCRTLIAAIVLSLVMFFTKRVWPQGWQAWSRIFILSFVGMFLPFLLYALAGERIPSALSAMYNAAVPVATVLITLIALRQEKVTLRKMIAIVIGAIGVLVLLAPWNLRAGNYDLLGQIYALFAVLFLGFAFAFTKKAITPLKLDPIGVAAGQVIVATVVGLLLLPFSDFQRIDITTEIFLSVLAIGVFSTGFAYAWNFRIIENWGATAASMVTYLTTVIGVIAGLFIMDELISLNQGIGVVIVLLGVAFGVSSRQNLIDSQKIK